MCQTPTSVSGSSKGRGFSKTPLTTLKMAVLPPMPSASVSTETAVNKGVRASLRNTYLSFVALQLLTVARSEKFPTRVEELSGREGRC